MFKKIPVWIKVIVGVPVGLWGIAQFNHWRIVQEEFKYAREYGQECIKKAVPIGDGNMSAYCGGKDTYAGAKMIVYDTSGQVAWPSERRSDLWRYMFLKNYEVFRRYKFQAEKIEGDFYSLFVEYDNPMDQDAINLEKKLECDAIMKDGKRSFECKNLHLLKK